MKFNSINIKYLQVFYTIYFITISSLSQGQESYYSKCNNIKWTYYYFTFNGKYKFSSESLVKKINQEVTNIKNNTNGFLTIRFLVNCKGEKGNYEILATDKNYQETKFDKEITDKALNFVKGLAIWEKGFWKYSSQPQDYYAFITFKFDNGKITEVIP